MSLFRPPALSAIILNYNHSRYILNSINAAASQTRPFDEIIVIDDASTDDSAALIESRIRDVPRARLIRNEKNMGVMLSTNLGLRESTGDYLFFMSADDSYSPHIVEWCHSALEACPHVAMISGNTRIRNADTGGERVFHLPFPQKIGCFGRRDVSRVARNQAFTFNVGANVVRRDAFIAAGQLIPALKWHSDWFLYLVIASRETFAAVPHEFVTVRQAGDQYSHACFHWPSQRPVIETLLQTLKTCYPDLYVFFRDCALLPTYDVEALGLWASNPTFRHYLTPLLFWRLLTYKPLRLLSRLCPDNARTIMRRLVRV
ncbi:MAG: glycosyltransferase family 2 protein [Bdellovibrionales bacterium]